MYQGELFILFYYFILFLSYFEVMLILLYLSCSFFLRLRNMRNKFSSRRSDLPNVLSNY